MAKRIEIQMKDGSWQERTVDSITTAELEYPMRCCGTNKQGRVCGATMVPVRTTDGKEKLLFFKRKSDSTPHICGCEFDESGEYCSSTRLDTRALYHTKEDIWNAMRIQNRRNGPQGPGGGPGGPGGGVVLPGEEDDRPDRPILRALRLPRSPAQYAAVLMGLNLDDRYADSCVRDLIIDPRTVEYHRYEGVREGQPVLILAKKLHPDNRVFEANKGEIVLVDAGYDAALEKNPTNCLQFRITLFGKAKTKLYECLKKSNNSVFIAIMARLFQDPEHDNTYFARGVDENRIGVVRLS